MSEIDFDILFKVILVGDSAVGKTNILRRFTKDDFMEDSRSTVGVEFSSKLFDVGDHKIKVNIWDTAGQERFRSITLSYYKGSKGAIIVFDVSRKETFDHIEKWHKVALYFRIIETPKQFFTFTFCKAAVFSNHYINEFNR